jgi:hypothetical protein
MAIGCADEVKCLADLSKMGKPCFVAYADEHLSILIHKTDAESEAYLSTGER